MAKKEKKDLSKIAGLLNYGTFFGESKIKILIPYFCILIIFLFLAIVTIVMLSIEQEMPNSTLAFTFTVIGCIIIFSLLPIILGIIIVKNEKMRSKVYLWLEDAVYVEAFAKSIGVKNQLFPAVKLQVDFDVDGVHYSKESHSNHYKHKYFEEGYYRIWSKYADRKIKILYSPKYDQVMVLKD